MKVILQQDVKGLGVKYSVVEVSDGYARNFLLPKGLAVEASPGNMNILKSKQKAEQARKERELQEAKALKERLSNIKIILTAKAGEGGKLFGAISNKDIADYLKKEHNIDIDKKKIQLEEPIKTTGTFTATIKLYPEVSANVNVTVKGE